MNTFDILDQPLLSEKAYKALAEGKYSFWVHKDANRTQVKNAVQAAFKVKVVAVNIQNVGGKTKRVGKYSGTRPDRKKAIVTLAEGQKIEALEGLV